MLLREDVDVTNEDSRNTIMSLVDIFHKQLPRVVIDPPADKESEVGLYLEGLREQPTMMFA